MNSIRWKVYPFMFSLHIKLEPGDNLEGDERGCLSPCSIYFVKLVIFTWLN